MSWTWAGDEFTLMQYHQRCVKILRVHVFLLWNTISVCVTLGISSVDFCFLPSLLFTAIEIGFTRRRIFHTEVLRQFETLINKSRVSEQTFNTLVEISTLNSPFGQSATQGEDFQVGFGNLPIVFRTLTPSEPNFSLGYQIIGDNTPENQEVFQLSITPAIGSPSFTCTEASGCFQQLEIVIQNDDGELWRFLLIYYFSISSAEWVGNLEAIVSNHCHQGSKISYSNIYKWTCTYCIIVQGEGHEPYIHVFHCTHYVYNDPHCQWTVVCLVASSQYLLWS